MRFFFLLFFVFTVPFGSPVRGETASLQGLVLDVSRHHPFVRGMAMELKARRNEATYRWLYYPDPTIEIAGMNSRADDLTISPEPGFGRMTGTGTEYRLSQAIPFPGRLTLEATVADLEAEASRLRFGMERNNLVAEFLATMIEIRAVRQTTQATIEISERMKLLHEVANGRYASGQGNLADVSIAALRHEMFGQKLLLVQSQFESTKNRLEFFLGNEKRNRPLPARVDAAIRLATDTASLADFLNRIKDDGAREKPDLTRNSLELGMARLAVRIRAKEKNVARFDYLPDFELFTGIREETLRSFDYSGNSRDRTVTTGVSIRVPLWSALANPARVNRRANEERAAKFSEKSVLAKLTADHMTEMARLRANQERLRKFDVILIPRAEEARQSAFFSYQAGRVDFSTVADTWEALYLLRVERIELETSAGMTVLNLGKIMNSILPGIESNDTRNEKAPRE